VISVTRAGEIELFGGNLQQRRPDALSELCLAGEHGHAPDRPLRLFHARNALANCLGV
jgi:hypothetical protein